MAYNDQPQDMTADKLLDEDDNPKNQQSHDPDDHKAEKKDIDTSNDQKEEETPTPKDDGSNDKQTSDSVEDSDLSSIEVKVDVNTEEAMEQLNEVQEKVQEVTEDLERLQKLAQQLGGGANSE